MQRLLQFAFVVGVAASLTACQKNVEKKDKKKAAQEKIAAAAKADPNTTPEMEKRKKRTNQVEPPMDVSAPPADALKSSSGMPYKVLTAGSGDKPGLNDTVMVNYTGWRTNGQMFYTSTRRGAPQAMSLVQVSKGWEEALTDMPKGEKRIYWMSPQMASRGKPSKDSGDLVFQIEVVDIQPAPPAPQHLTGPAPDATKTKSGLAFKVLKPGTGADKPRMWDQVTVHYTTWNTEGRIIDSTQIRKRPRPVQLFREPEFWQESLMSMVEGQINRVWIPEDMLKKQAKAKPAAGGLVVDFELVSLKKMNQPPPVPKDVAKPPAGAQKTANGVMYKVIKKGQGKEKPTADKTVKVHYTGWTTDGKMFDSSVVRGQPAQFPLRGVIPGWTEGVQVMVVGDTTRFWIPEEMAYKGKPNRPQGMLVFDIELIEIMAAPARPGHHQPGGMSKSHGNLQPAKPDVKPKKPGADGKTPAPNSKAPAPKKPAPKKAPAPKQ